MKKIACLLLLFVTFQVSAQEFYPEDRFEFCQYDKL